MGSSLPSIRKPQNVISPHTQHTLRAASGRALTAYRPLLMEIRYLQLQGKHSADQPTNRLIRKPKTNTGRLLFVHNDLERVLTASTYLHCTNLDLK